MLIRFTVENFLSFKDEMELSMVPGRARKHKEHVHVDSRRKDIRLLKTSVLYGANAAGKTNLIKAMDFAQNLIVNGRRANESLSATPFLLDKESGKRPSKFMFEFKTGEKAYSYRFEVDSSRVRFESLHEIRPSSEKMVFTRFTDNDGQTHLEQGSLLKGLSQDDMFLEFTARGTRPNQLYLTETIERNIRYFEDVYQWFSRSLVLIFHYFVPGAELGPSYRNNQDRFRDKYRDLIQLYDLDIVDIALRPLDIDPDQLFSDQDRLNIDRLVRELPEEEDAKAVLYSPNLQVFVFIDRLNRFEIFQFVTVHYVKREDRHVHFELHMESDGTNRLFQLTPALIRLLSSNEETVFVIDELDRSFHSQMTRNILDIYLSNSENRPSQLIATTHESGLLDLDLLRRDEIWFIEKNAEAVSTMYSLEEFAPRFDVDIERGYLIGRYGAIPVLPSFNVLDWAN